LGAIILIVTVVIITMNIMGSNKPSQAAIPVSEDYKEIAEELEWYTSLGEIQTRTSDPIPASVVVNIFLGYKKEDKATSTEITQRTVELKDFLRRYFTQKTAEELRPQNEENLKIEIRNAINDSILSSSKIKDVRFMQMDVIQQ
jgi:flagellar FliL protein